MGPRKIAENASDALMREMSPQISNSRNPRRNHEVEATKEAVSEVAEAIRVDHLAVTMTAVEEVAGAVTATEVPILQLAVIRDPIQSRSLRLLTQPAKHHEVAVMKVAHVTARVVGMEEAGAPRADQEEAVMVEPQDTEAI